MAAVVSEIKICAPLLLKAHPRRCSRGRLSRLFEASQKRAFRFGCALKTWMSEIPLIVSSSSPASSRELS